MPGTGFITLSGSGVHHLSDSGIVPTDMDLQVLTVGPNVVATGDAPHRLFKFLGWLQLFNSTFGNEAVTDPIYFNCELQDVPITTVLASPATDFYYNVKQLSEVQVQFSW